jgi:hypothetical protein
VYVLAVVLQSTTDPALMGAFAAPLEIGLYAGGCGLLDLSPDGCVAGLHATFQAEAR